MFTCAVRTRSAVSSVSSVLQLPVAAASAGPQPSSPYDPEGQSNTHTRTHTQVSHTHVSQPHTQKIKPNRGHLEHINTHLSVLDTELTSPLERASCGGQMFVDKSNYPLQ